MQRAKLIVIFLLALFSLQLLPVKQVGSLIYANQLLEEMPHSCESGSAKFSDEVKHHDCSCHMYSVVLPALLSTPDNPAGSIIICSRNSDDILTPPPNA